MEKAEPNYFKVNRELLTSNRWLAEKFTRAQAWVDLFGLAQHKKNFFMIRGIKVDIKRGQLAYSQLTLSKRWGWSRDKVRRYLKCLENDGDIRQQNNEVTTLITILKYDFWQGNNTTDQTTEKQQKNNKQDTYKEVKKDKNIIISKDITEPKGSEDIKKSKKNPIIDTLIQGIKKFLKIEALDGSIRQNRQYAWLVWKNKLKEDIKRMNPILISISKDEFHRQNMTSMKYLYYNWEKIKRSGSSCPTIIQTQRTEEIINDFKEQYGKNNIQA